MGKPPSLTLLCLEAVKAELLRGDDLVQHVCDFPSSLFEILVLMSPPLVVQKLQMSVNFEDRNGDNYDDYGRGNGRKRGRSWNFNEVWMGLFERRWPKLKVKSDDWQQVYWETHLQSCLDEVAEVAFLPSFLGNVGEIKISDDMLKHIGVKVNSCTSDYTKLSYHFQEFGHYARCVRLQSSLCSPKTSHLLRKCKLENLVLEWIKSKEQIDGVCKLLSQNRESLSSLEFCHCKFSSTSVDKIFGSLTTNSTPTHGIKKFSISESVFLETDLGSLPLGFISFLSSGRSLCSLKLSGIYLGRDAANMVLNTLRDVPGLSVLDLSENHIRGWLSAFNPRSTKNHPTSPEFGKSWQSLRLLNIRGNHLGYSDAICLGYALVHMPTLEVLDISENAIGSDGIRSLLPYIVKASEKGFPLAELHVEYCEICDIGVIDLLNSLSTLRKPLKSLSIANNAAGSKVAAALGKLLSTSIQKLNISCIGLGLDGFRALQQSIPEELTLVEINFSFNCGQIGAAEFLSTILSRGPGLVSVNASYNCIPVKSSNKIRSAIKALKGNLVSVNLEEELNSQIDETHVRPTLRPISNARYDHDP